MDSNSIVPCHFHTRSLYIYSNMTQCALHRVPSPHSYTLDRGPLIIYYMTHRPCDHICMPIAIIIANAVVLCTLLESDCHVNYIKTGAATEAVLLFVLLINVGDANTTRDPMKLDQQEEINKKLEGWRKLQEEKRIREQEKVKPLAFAEELKRKERSS